MKLQRLLGAIGAIVMFVSVAGAAEQSSYVAPGSGPMSMATFVANYLNPALRALAACHNGASAPANGPGSGPMAYQLWCDTTGNPAIVKMYDGASWVAIGSLNTTTHAWSPYLTGGVSGGVPYFSAAGIMGSSAALAQYGFVVGGGAGAAPATIAACTDDQIAFGRTSNSPLCRTVTGDITFSSGVSAIGASKVTNAQLATMVANTTKCNATAGTANPTDCSGATMRTNLGLVIGTNVEAWDNDLDCLAALATSGIVARSGAGTCATRTMTPPAAGISISNGDGVAGNPTLALTNDLAALEALSGTGIARRTGTDTWSVGGGIANSELATMAAYSFKLNNTGSAAPPTDVEISTLATKASPASGDYVILSDQASSGALKKATVASIGSAGSVSSIAGNTGAFTLANGIDNSGNQIQLTVARRTLPTVQGPFTSGTNVNYTTPANVLWIEVWIIGGGGGGGGANNTATATAGNPSCWSASGAACTAPLYQAGGGSGAVGATGGLGGTISGTGTCNRLASSGNPGSGGGASVPSGGGGLGGTGGSSILGGAGAGSSGTAIANTGSGGGGGSMGNSVSANAGGGGGSGATCAVIINNPAASYVYSVGAGGSGTTAGSGGNAGGNGAAGKIWIIEHYGS